MNRKKWRVSVFSELIMLVGTAFLVAACAGTTARPAQPPTAQLAPTAPVAETNLITVVADNWCPYNCDPGSEYPGYVIELATEIFQKAGYRLKYENVPWSRAVRGVEEGIYDGAVGAALGDIPGAIFPEEEVGSLLNCMFVRKGETWRYTDLDSLKNIRLGVIGDYYYTDEINAYINASQNSPQVDIIRGANAVERNLKKLLDQKIDVYLEDLSVVYYTAAQAGLDKDEFEISGTIDEPQAIYIAFSPKDPESEKWAQILSQGIKESRENGRLAEILRRYGLKDWK
jgi:polar amino acid transport system substrate-binding protein